MTSSLLMLSQLEFCQAQVDLRRAADYFEAQGDPFSEIKARMLERQLEGINQLEDRRIERATSWADSEVAKWEAEQDALRAAKQANKENTPSPYKFYPNTTPMTQPAGKLNVAFMPVPTLVVPEHYRFQTTPEGYACFTDWTSLSIDETIAYADMCLELTYPTSQDVADFKEYKDLYFKIYNMLAKDQLRVACAKLGLVTYGKKEAMVDRLLERAIRDAARGYTEVRDNVGVVRITPPPEGPQKKELVLMDLAEEGLALDEDGYPIALDEEGNPVTLDDVDEGSLESYFEGMTVDEVATAMQRASIADNNVEVEDPSVNEVSAIMNGLSIADSTADLVADNFNALPAGLPFSVYRDNDPDYIAFQHDASEHNGTDHANI